MAVHGVITKIVKVGDDLVLSLGQPPDSTDPIGQSSLIIEKFTKVPDIGDRVWGGSDNIRIESVSQLVYKRKTLIRLIESR
jgi:hypothetical protein